MMTFHNVTKEKTILDNGFQSECIFNLTLIYSGEFKINQKMLSIKIVSKLSIFF